MEKSDNLQAILSDSATAEIYTTAEIRARLGLREGGLVRAYIVGDKLVIKPLERLEDRIKRSVVTLSPHEAEELSEEAQKEAGILG